MLRVPGAWFGAVLLVLLLRAGGPGIAAGQETGTESLLERGRKAGADAKQMQMVAQRARRAGLSAEATASLLRPAVALAEQDLPTGPLL